MFSLQPLGYSVTHRPARPRADEWSSVTTASPLSIHTRHSKCCAVLLCLTLPLAPFKCVPRPLPAKRAPACHTEAARTLA